MTAQTINSPIRSESIQHLLLSLVQCGHHAHDLLPPVDYELALLHQFVQDLRFVKFLQQLALQILLGVVHEREHDRLRDHIDHLPLYYVEIGVDEEFYGDISCEHGLGMDRPDDLLMTSVSMVSRSLSADWGLIIAGGYRMNGC